MHFREAAKLKPKPFSSVRDASFFSGPRSARTPPAKSPFDPRSWTHTAKLALRFFSSSAGEFDRHQLALVPAAPHDQIFHLFESPEMLRNCVSPHLVYSRTVRRVKRHLSISICWRSLSVFTISVISASSLRPAVAARRAKV